MFSVLGDNVRVRNVNYEAPGTGKVFSRERMNTGFKNLFCKEYKTLSCLQDPWFLDDTTQIHYGDTKEP